MCYGNRLQEIKKNIVNSESLMGNLSPSELSASCLKDILTRHVDPADCSLPLSREQVDRYHYFLLYTFLTAFFIDIVSIPD